MADNETTPNEGSPFTRPAFLVAAVVVLVIALLGAIVAFRAARSNDTTPTPSTSVTTDVTPSNPVSTPAADASVCGLPDGDQGELTAGPAATWKYQGTIAYPESPEQGPGKTAPEGYRYCFQHSPAGAVLMAANAIAQGSDSAVSGEWMNYALAEGPHRAALLAQGGTAGSQEGVRLQIAGFRVLEADEMTIRVDLAATGSAQGQNVMVSTIYELVWQGGDWKLSSDVERPIDVGVIPDLTNYIPWGE